MRARVTWPDVVKTLQDDEARAVVMSRYNASGWCPDDFARRIEARKVIVEGFVSVEDIWEFKRGSLATELRTRVQAIRRQLEVELYP